MQQLYANDVQVELWALQRSPQPQPQVQIRLGGAGGADVAKVNDPLQPNHCDNSSRVVAFGLGVVPATNIVCSPGSDRASTIRLQFTVFSVLTTRTVGKSAGSARPASPCSTPRAMAACPRKSSGFARSHRIFLAKLPSPACSSADSDAPPAVQFRDQLAERCRLGKGVPLAAKGSVGLDPGAGLSLSLLREPIIT